MTEEQVTLLVIKGTISELPPVAQAQVNECAERLRMLLDEYGPVGQMSFALVGAELAASA